MGLLTFDDRDPLVSYSASGNWQQGGVTEEYNTTTTWTTVGGSTATLTFTGTSIGVYGTIANVGLGTAPQSSYSVDGGPTSTFTGKMLSTIQYQQEFFLNKNLSANAQHTLVVKTVGDGGFFYLDYFLVTPADGSGAGRVSAPSGSSSSSSSGSSSTSTSVSSTPSTSSPSTTSPSASSTRSAAETDSTIDTDVKVGLVVLILGILVVIFVVIMVLRRRRKNAMKKRKFDETEIQSLWTRPQSSASSQITPFLMDPAPPPVANTHTQTTTEDTEPGTVSPYPFFPQFTTTIAPNLMPSMLSRTERPTPTPTPIPQQQQQQVQPQQSSGKGGVMYGYAPLPLPDADPFASSSSASALASSSMGWGGKRQLQQQQLLEEQQQRRLLAPGTVASGSGSGSSSSSSSNASSSGHARTGSAVSNASATASSTVPVQSASQPLLNRAEPEEAMYDNPFEPPPPQYDTYA